MKGNKAFLIPLFCSVAMAIVLTILHPVVQTFDSASYVDAWTSLGQGRLDMVRTPVYPVILHLMQVVFGSGFLYATVCLQYLVFFLSIRAFHRLADFFCSPGASFWVTLVYAACPAICAWSNLILTESFAISGCVFLLYLAHRLCQSPSVGMAVLFTVQVLILLFLRPAFVYILPVFAVFALLLFLQRKKQAALLFLAGIVVASLCLVGYMGAFKKEYGVFAPSSISIVNQYSIARNFGYIDPDDAPDSLLKNDLATFSDAHGKKADAGVATHEGFDLCQKHPLRDIKSTVAAGKKRAPLTVLKGIVVRAYTSCLDPAFSSWMPSINRLSRAFGPTLGLLYLFLLFYLVILCIRMVQHRTIPPYCVLFLLLGLANVAIAILGAQNDWGRITAPSIPIWLLLAGQVGRFFSKKETGALV